MSSDVILGGQALGRERIRAAAKVVLGVGSLTLVLVLASLLPGLDLLVPETSVSLLAVLAAIGAVGVAALLLYVARSLATLVRLSIDGPDHVVEHFASVVHWTVVLSGVFVLHSGFGPLAAVLLGGLVWTYDLFFLLAGLVPLCIVAVRLYVAIDPAADALADNVTDSNAN